MNSPRPVFISAIASSRAMAFFLSIAAVVSVHLGIVITFVPKLGMTSDGLHGRHDGDEDGYRNCDVPIRQDCGTHDQEYEEGEENTRTPIPSPSGVDDGISICHVLTFVMWPPLLGDILSVVLVR